MEELCSLREAGTGKSYFWQNNCLWIINWNMFR